MPLQPAPEPSMTLVPPAVVGEFPLQLQKARSAPAGYSGGFHALDSLIAGHDGFKHDVDLIKVSMEECKPEVQKIEQNYNEESSSDNITRHLETLQSALEPPIPSGPTGLHSEYDSVSRT